MFFFRMQSVHFFGLQSRHMMPSNADLEVENILFDQKVLRGGSIKIKRVSENFPLTAHLNTLSVPLDTHFSKLKISK